ncbi:Pvc16 family protein [Streptomyces sp. YIM S03343]
MIHEVDEGLRRLLAESGLEASGVEVVFDAPTRDWAARRSAPTVCVFLYDIREDALRRGTGAGEVYDEDGHLVARRSPPRWFQLTYLVTAWASRPQDEHRLLSEVLGCLVAHDTLPGELLTGSLAELGLTVGLETAGAGMDAPAAADVWSALGGEMKASLGIRVRAPLAGVTRASAPPVTEGLVVRSAAAREGEEASPGRRLRYTEVTDPGRDGFTGPRERPPAPARRRRRGDRQP